MTTSVARKSAPPWLAPALGIGAFLGVAIALGLYSAPPQIPGAGTLGRMAPRVPMRPPNLPTLLWLMGVGSSLWYVCVFAFPLLLWGVRRLDMERMGRRQLLLLSVTAFLLLVFAVSAGEYFALYHGLTNQPDFLSYLPVALRQSLLPLIALTSVVAAIEVRRRAVHSQLDRERLRAQVAEQRLIALTGQLQPHFLFNTLQGISTLIHRSPRDADAMLALLSDLLRDLLRHRDHVLVPLADELRDARTVLELAKYRFAERLEFGVEAAPDLLSLKVPLFILQPLVENALTHGIGAVVRGGRIDVKVTRVGDSLHLDVSDNGAGIAAGGSPGSLERSVIEGIGLSNTRERLEASFGDAQCLELRARAGGGTVAHLEVPCRSSSPEFLRAPVRGQ